MADSVTASIGEAEDYGTSAPDRVSHTVLVEVDPGSTGRIEVYVDAPYRRIAVVLVAGECCRRGGGG